MKIDFENVDFNSKSGPNGFGLKLARAFTDMGHQITYDNPDVRLSFIQSANNFNPTVLRLDGIYFNIDQDFVSLNMPIKKSYDYAKLVIVQSSFNKKLVEKYFGKKERIEVINNGTDTSIIEAVPVAQTNLSKNQIWMCASSWRPHKRLEENIEYFKAFSEREDILLVAGSNSEKFIKDEDRNNPRIKLLGDLNWHQMISCMKASSKFLHLAWLDHCPNVVVDARASGCKIICSSSGGTKEIAGLGDTIILEEEWNFEPTQLYSPPKMNFEKSSVKESEISININDVSKKYENALLRVSI